MTRADGGRRRILLQTPQRGLWWVSPVGSLALVLPLSLGLAVRIPDSSYRLFYREPRWMTGSQALLFLLAGVVLATASLLPLAAGRPGWSRDWGRFSAAERALLTRASSVCWWLTVAGYSAYLAVGLLRGVRPALLISVLGSSGGASDRLKELFAPVTGVTTLTQVGIAYAVLAALLLQDRATASLRRRLGVVVLLSLARAFLLSERLALLEVAVPLVALAAVSARRRSRRGWLLPAAPALFLPSLIVVFGAFEYSRSWAFFRSRTSTGFGSFVVNRLAGYYATSYNNGALLLDNRPRGRIPYDTIEALWTAPVISQLHLYQRLNHAPGGALLEQVLTQHANPEFNNPGGLAVPVLDWGVAGGLLFFVLAGVLIGIVYSHFRAGSPLGLLLYAPLFTGLLELPRYLYWVQGRLVPALVALGVTAVALRRLQERERTAVRAGGRGRRRP